jgi:sugar phosphate isomerase/epimerase
MNRRSFLGTITAAALLTRRLGWSANDRKIENIGVQLYTVREAMKQDFEGTLATVAAIGYREVEFAGYFDHSPQEVRAALDRHGLVAPSTHVDYDSLGEKWPQVIEASKMIGHGYIVNPDIGDELRNQPDGWKRAAETFNRAGEASKKAGIQFAYHNHWFEFKPVNGKRPYDILLEECDPNMVKMELDLCWITVTGQDPLVYFHRYPGRFPLVHVKDMKRIQSPAVTAGISSEDQFFPDMADVGSGVIDWKRIFAKSEEAGIRHCFIEHDDPKSAFDSIRISYKYVQALRF